MMDFKVKIEFCNIEISIFCYKFNVVNLKSYSNRGIFTHYKIICDE